MIAFIDDHREAYGVEPICKVLPIAPSTYRAHAAKRADPAKLSARAKQDAIRKIEIRRVLAENFDVYGVRKVWRQLRREGEDIAGVGGPVQQSPAAGAHRQHPASRSREALLCHDGPTRHRGVNSNETASGKPGAVQVETQLNRRRTGALREPRVQAGVAVVCGKRSCGSSLAGISPCWHEDAREDRALAGC